MSEYRERRIILHVDMDAFFAAIEQRNNPTLRGKPVIIGGPVGSRSVVSTCSYEARKFGVHSAMPIKQAFNKCPEGIFLNLDPAAYCFAAQQIKTIFLRFSPLVQMISVDEAFIDITGSERKNGTLVEIAGRIKSAVREGIGITCSVGIGNNKLIAKLASGMEKPDGLTIIWREDLEKRVYPLEVGRLWGVGPVTQKYLASKGIVTIGDLARTDAKRLRRELGVRGLFLGERARAVDEGLVLDEYSQPEEKSISHERTLVRDVSDLTLINALILTLSEKVSIRMKRGHWLAQVATLRIRYPDFKTITRQTRFGEPTDNSDRIFQVARDLLPSEVVVAQGVRLVGVRVSQLINRDKFCQPELFTDAKSSGRRSLDEVINCLRVKFGDSIITKAGTFLHGE